MRDTQQGYTTGIKIRDAKQGGVGGGGQNDYLPNFYSESIILGHFRRFVSTKEKVHRNYY